MRVLLVVLAAGAVVLAVPATAYAQPCTRNAKPDGQVAEGEYAIVSFAPKPNNPSQEISTVHYGPGSTIPGAIGGASFLSGVIINPRGCAVAAAPAVALAPASDPAKQFAVPVVCNYPPAPATVTVITGPAVVTSMPINSGLVIEVGGKSVSGLEKHWTGELRLAAGAALKMNCGLGGVVVIGLVTGYRL